jgi:Holliday junction resolvase RusA-like endonuclease
MKLIITLELEHRPLPKERPRSGRGRMFTSKRTRHYEAFIAHVARAAYDGELLDGALRLEVDLYYSNRAHLPDVDNAAKAIADALNGIIYKDDRYIEQLLVSRSIVKGQLERSVVRIYRLESIDLL